MSDIRRVAVICDQRTVAVWSEMGGFCEDVLEWNFMDLTWTRDLTNNWKLDGKVS